LIGAVGNRKSGRAEKVRYWGSRTAPSAAAADRTHVRHHPEIAGWLKMCRDRALFKDNIFSKLEQNSIAVLMNRVIYAAKLVKPDGEIAFYNEEFGNQDTLQTYIAFGVNGVICKPDSAQQSSSCRLNKRRCNLAEKRSRIQYAGIIGDFKIVSTAPNCVIYLFGGRCTVRGLPQPCGCEASIRRCGVQL
jgi:hypothetical protein